MRFFLAVLSFAGLLSQALAEDIAREARSGQPTSLFVFSIYSIGTCTAGPLAEPKIIRQGQNGVVRISASSSLLDARQCGSLKAWGQNVVYTSRPGFRGSDQIVVEFAYNPTVEAPRLTSTRYTVTINVR
ncbi:MAG TPA: hypothetical protein PKW21_02240 [Rhabdaerophilum sp.]|nr:hypothetical protein [Rhabdaerophilum sp.]